jgi:hypothetical protein
MDAVVLRRTTAMDVVVLWGTTPIDKTLFCGELLRSTKHWWLERSKRNDSQALRTEN